MNETLELCFKCDEPTGCAGKADDSWYNEDNEGPFCWRCWCEDQFPKVAEEIESLQSQISTLQDMLKEAYPILDRHTHSDCLGPESLVTRIFDAVIKIDLPTGEQESKHNAKDNT